MKILAIDTSSEACSAALFTDDSIAERYQIAPREHSKLILPMMEELLAEAGLTLKQLDALAFGRGPGSFTGVRIAASVIQGVAFGADLPVVPVSSLAALAQGMYREDKVEQVFAAFDARMQEVYWGAYELGPEGLMELQGEEQVILPQSVPVSDIGGEKDWMGAGSGWETYHDVMSERLQGQLKDWKGDVFPHAQDILPLALTGFRNGQAVAAEMAIPVYLRDKVAWKKSKTVLGRAQ